MENRTIKKIVKSLITTLQVILFIIPIVLQYLSDQKMGVKRYLVYKIMVFSKEVFAIRLIFILKFMLILGLIIGIALFIYYSIKKIGGTFIKTAIKILILNLLAIGFVFSKQCQGLMAYHFFLIAIFGIIILQYIKVGIGYQGE